jgi:hypothetical protein
MRNVRVAVLLAGLVPLILEAQDPVLRLRDVAPPELRSQILAAVDEAGAQGLPGDVVAQVALEGLAKGRSGPAVAQAAHQAAVQLAEGRQAFTQSGRTPSPEEMRAAALALHLGVGGAEIRELAAGAPADRSLAVPLVVMGLLAERGVPVSQALSIVRARLHERADDVTLASLMGGIASVPGMGNPLPAVGTTLAGMKAGFAVPASGFIVPHGPPAGVPRNGGRPESPGKPFPSSPGRSGTPGGDS